MYENLGLNKSAQTPKNKMVEEQKKLNNNVEQLKPQLVSIQYENMKLNAQIYTLNKTIDSKDDELSKLRDINAELKLTNKTLEESNKSNKHYWRNTIIISLGVGVFSFILGLFSTEAKTLLQSILALLQ